jgi:hypothetical protein
MTAAARFVSDTALFDTLTATTGRDGAVSVYGYAGGTITHLLGRLDGTTPAVAAVDDARSAAVTAPATGTQPRVPCPDGVPWCLGDLDWHDGPGDACHDSPFTIVSTGDPRCTRHIEDGGEHRAGRADTVWLAIEREDVDGRTGEPTVYLAPNCAQPGHCEEAHLGLDDAEHLAHELLRLVAIARGAKRAADIRVGDVLVINGVEQTAVVVLHDGECLHQPECAYGQCPDGSVGIRTDRTGEGDWAATYALDELVTVRPAGVSE